MTDGERQLTTLRRIRLANRSAEMKVSYSREAGAECLGHCLAVRHRDLSHWLIRRASKAAGLPKLTSAAASKSYSLDSPQKIRFSSLPLKDSPASWTVKIQSQMRCLGCGGGQRQEGRDADRYICGSHPEITLDLRRRRHQHGTSAPFSYRPHYRLVENG